MRYLYGSNWLLVNQEDGTNKDLRGFLDARCEASGSLDQENIYISKSVPCPELLDKLGTLDPSQFMFLLAVNERSRNVLRGDLAVDLIKAIYIVACPNLVLTRGKEENNQDQACIETVGTRIRISYPDFTGLLIGSGGCNVKRVRDTLKQAFGKSQDIMIDN